MSRRDGNLATASAERAPSIVTYRLVTRFGSGEIAHSVERDALVVVREKTGRRDVVPFSTMTVVNLRQELPGAWTMRISRRKGGALTIPARHFAGLGRFELRAGEYRAFVDALHGASRASNPRIRYVAGSSGLYALGLVLLAFAALFGAALVYGLAIGDPPPRRAFLGLPVAIVVALAFVKQGRAKPYDPTAPPPAFLPPAEAPT